MVRLILFVLLCVSISGEAAAQGPVPLSTSPLVPLATDAGPGWRVTAAVPSPDCDLALELFNDDSHTYRWQAGEARIEEVMSVLGTEVLGVSFDFRYATDGGLFPIVNTYTPRLTPTQPAGSWLHRAGGPTLATLSYGGPFTPQGDRVSTEILRLIPRSGKLPLHAFAETRYLPIFPVPYFTNRVYMPETSTMVTFLSTETLTHDAAGALAGFAVVGGRLGETVRDETTLAVREPTIPEAQITIHAAGISATRRAAVLPLGTNGLRLVTWDASTSETVVLRASDGTNAGLPVWNDSLGFCEPMGADGWLVGLECAGKASVWAVAGGDVHPCPLPAEAISFTAWDGYFADPSAPLLCFVVGSPLGDLTRHVLVGAKWDAAARSWTVVPLAEEVSTREALRIPRVGRNAAGVATVCFEGRIATTPSSTSIYSVALDGAEPLSPAAITGDAWIVQ